MPCKLPRRRELRNGAVGRGPGKAVSHCLFAKSMERALSAIKSCPEHFMTDFLPISFCLFISGFWNAWGFRHCISWSALLHLVRAYLGVTLKSHGFTDVYLCSLLSLHTSNPCLRLELPLVISQCRSYVQRSSWMTDRHLKCSASKTQHTLRRKPFSPASQRRAATSIQVLRPKPAVVPDSTSPCLIHWVSMCLLPALQCVSGTQGSLWPHWARPLFSLICAVPAAV